MMVKDKLLAKKVIAEKLTMHTTKYWWKTVGVGRLLTNWGPDQSGSCLISIWPLPDFNLAAAWFYHSGCLIDQAAA